MAYNVVVFKTMRLVTVTRTGQLSLPADVRRRWGARKVALEDHDDYVVLRPLTDDAVSAFVGSFEGRGPASEELPPEDRRQEQAREQKASDNRPRCLRTDRGGPEGAGGRRGRAPTPSRWTARSRRSTSPR